MRDFSLSGIYAEPFEIVQDGINLVAKAGELSIQLKKFEENINGLMSVWKGDAATSLSNVYNELKPQLSSFCEMLNSKGHALDAAGNSLGQTEDDNAAAANRLGN